MNENETDADFLRSLAELLKTIQVMHGIDGADISRLNEIASRVECLFDFSTSDE